MPTPSAPSAPTPPPIIHSTPAHPEAAAHLARTFAFQWNDLIVSLSTPDFYLGWMFIGLALALGWLMAVLIRRRAQKYLEAHPPHFIDAEVILASLALLWPVLALLYLGIAKPLMKEYTASGARLADAIIEVCFAWLFARCILLAVRSRGVAWFIAFIIMLAGTLRATGFIRPVVFYLRSIQFDIGQFQISMLNIVHGIVILVVVFWVAGASSRTLESFLRRTSSLSYNTRELIVKFFRVFIYLLALMITLSALGVDLTAFAVFGGALGVGVGLGLQKITGNFVSGVTMLMEKSIQIGDLIEVGGITGRVRQLNIRYALIETADGREVMIPNEELLSTRVTNWTHTSNTARIDLKVNVDYKSDPATVIALMLGAAQEHPVCLKEPPPSCFLREFGDNAMQFLLTFWISDVRAGRMEPQSQVMISILEKFKAAKIGIPCPAAANQVGNL